MDPSSCYSLDQPFFFTFNLKMTHKNKHYTFELTLLITFFHQWQYVLSNPKNFVSWNYQFVQQLPLIYRRNVKSVSIVNHSDDYKTQLIWKMSTIRKFNMFKNITGVEEKTIAHCFPIYIPCDAGTLFWFADPRC